MVEPKPFVLYSWRSERILRVPTQGTCNQKDFFNVYRCFGNGAEVSTMLLNGHLMEWQETIVAGNHFGFWF
jgi:hypothetical protein